MGKAGAGDPAPIAEASFQRLLPAGPIGVAVSGGGDSMALLAMLHARAHAGQALHVATVDHGLRPESVREAHMVARFCAERDISHAMMTLGDLSGPGNLSAKAREGRYAVLADWARSLGLSAVLLGHTMDDQAETLLMRLARGSGVEGLSAMDERVTHYGIPFLRPFLGIRREPLRDYLRLADIRWSDDPTNEDPQYDRVKARKAIKALGPLGIDVECLAETSNRLQRQRVVLEDAASSLASRAVRWGALGEVLIDTSKLRDDIRDTAFRVFADILRVVGRGAYRPRFRALEAAFDRITQEGVGPSATLAGCMIVPGPDEILICREPSAVPPPLPLHGGDVVWDGHWLVSVPPGNGLFVGAAGAEGCTALKRLAEDDKYLPTEAWQRSLRPVRLSTPAIYNASTAKGAEMIAAPLAGYFGPGSENQVRITHAPDPTRLRR